MKVKVTQPFRVVHDGVAYGPGDTADVDDDTAAQWIERGWVTEIKPTRSKR